MSPLSVVDYIQKRWFHSCAFWVSVDSSAVVFFTRARLGVVGYIRGCWARSSALCGSLGSSGVIDAYTLGVVLFIWCRLVRLPFPWGRWVHLWSLGSFLRLGIFGFASMRPVVRAVHPMSLGSLARALGVVGFIQGRWVHSFAPLGSLGSSMDVWFSWVCLWGRWVHSW